MAPKANLRMGTRGSALALWQARTVRDRLAAAHGLSPDEIDIVPIKTSGDRIRDRPLADAGGKGLFTKEIEEALLSGAVDIAVHSAKDMETSLPPGLTIGACLEREDVRDALIARDASEVADLPQGATVGTASMRREALLKRMRPDLKTELLRGNVPTRLQAVESGRVVATLLAAAGLNRLGLQDHITALLSLESFPPACGQGVVAIECRESDVSMRQMLASIDHPDTSAALACERGFLAALDGSCRTPIAGHARLTEGALRFDGIVLAPDGSESYSASGAGGSAAAASIGRRAGEEIRDGAPEGFLARIGIG